MNIPEFLPVLSHGSHDNPSKGACVMEMVSFLAGEDFSDKPECVNITLRVEAISINDLVSDDNRNQIALLIPRFMNTSKLNGNDEFTDAVNEARVEYLTRHGFKRNGYISSAIKDAFATDVGDKRRTNQEYDQIGIDWLGVILDIADKFLGRDTPSVEATVSVLEKTKLHVSQVNA